MHVVVLGAGVAGVTTAWYLARAGCRVTVIDREPAPARSTTLDHAGHVATGAVDHWASPRNLAYLWRDAGRGPVPFQFVPSTQAWHWEWLWRFVRQCSRPRSRRNARSLASLLLYSRKELASLRDALQLDYQSDTRGVLRVFQDASGFADALDALPRWRELGLDVEPCGPPRCKQLEPMLAGCSDAIAGGVYFPNDEAGDPRAFVAGLARQCEAAGVHFRLGTTVRTLSLEGRDVTAVRVGSESGEVESCAGDAFVVALGWESHALLRSVGVRTWVASVRAHTLSIPYPAGTCMPIYDETHQAAFACRSGRLWVSGGAVLGPGASKADEDAFAGLEGAARALFMDLPADLGADRLVGVQSATPGGVPLIGRTEHRNLYVIAGQGSVGWTLACGAGRAIADMVCGRKPEPEFPFRGLRH